MPELQRFTVTVRVFDPTAADGEPSTTHALPVDSPDAEHAVSAAMSNAVAFTPTTRDGVTVPVAFRAVAVDERV